jgi:hypothetical protein
MLGKAELAKPATRAGAARSGLAPSCCPFVAARVRRLASADAPGKCGCGDGLSPPTTGKIFFSKVFWPGNVTYCKTSYGAGVCKHGTDVSADISATGFY